MLRNAVIDDALEICKIYNYYIENTIISFEEVPVSVEEMKNRIREVTEKYPWLVCEKNGSIAGYAYASKWKDRTAYRYSAESSIYLAQDAVGQGIGNKLYKALISRISGMSIHSVIGGIALPNPASVALHEKLGFKKVACFKEIGRKFSQWIDVGYWELIIDDSRPER